MLVLRNQEGPPQVFRLPSGTRTIVENAMQSCLQISTLCSEKIAKARILRARARLAAGLQFSANEGIFSPLRDMVPFANHSHFAQTWKRR